MIMRLRGFAAAAAAATFAVAGGVFLAGTAHATDYTAGLTSTAGTSADWGNQNGMSATQITTTTTGQSTSVSLYLSAVQAAPANHGQVALYTDQNNLPGPLAGGSATKPLTTRWNSFPLPGLAVTAATKYWLVFNVDGANTRYAIKSGGRSAWRIPTTFGTWPASFGVPNTGPVAQQYALYLTYSEIGRASCRERV